MLRQETGNCLIYEDRPFGCRTHFCAAAGGPLARREVLDLIRRLENVALVLDGNGPRPLQNAVADVLEDMRYTRPRSATSFGSCRAKSKCSTVAELPTRH